MTVFSQAVLSRFTDLEVASGRTMSSRLEKDDNAELSEGLFLMRPKTSRSWPEMQLLME